jgi:hypothetical protein
MVRMYSRLLEETIVCVEDSQSSESGDERVLYTRSEVIALQGLPPEDLRAVHEMKKHFGGRYAGRVPPA